MKIQKLTMILLSIMSVLACEDNTLQEQNNTQASENQNLDPIYLARNFDKQLSTQEAKKNAKAYFQLDFDQMKHFIEERYDMSLEKGVNPKEADIAKNLMLDINDFLQKEYGQSYSNANPDDFLKAYKTITQNPKYADYSSEHLNEKFWWGCDSWTRSGKTSITGGSGSGMQQSISFKGEYKLNGSGDCDFVYQSSPYSSNLTPRYIYGVTTKSYAALTYEGSNQNSSKEVYVNSNQKSFEFLIGKGRVLQAYGLFGNGQQNFANDTKILLY